MTEETTHIEKKAAETLETEVLENEAPKTSPIPVLPELSMALGLLVVVFGVTYVGATHTLTKNSTEDVTVKTTLAPNNASEAALSDAFSEIKIIAKSAIVWDVNAQKILFNKNADDQLPLASVTKLMTALVAYELLDPNETVAVSRNALKTEGDSGFVDGEEFTMQNLADLTLISSSNDGATALSTLGGSAISATGNPEDVFVRAMNLKADELGLTKTYFKNSTGLDISTTSAGAFGSARDVAFLMEYIIKNTVDAVALTTLDMTTINNENGEYHTAKNTNEIVDSIDGLIASKTGYTPLAGGNLVVAFNAGLNRPIIVAVLGSSQNGRFDDVLKLVKETRLYIQAEAE